MQRRAAAKKSAVKSAATKKTQRPDAGSDAPGAAVYRRLALALPDAVESSHMGAADFRIQRGATTRIFATLAFVDQGLGTLLLSPEQQQAFVAESPEYFMPAPGGWARGGATVVRLDAPEQVLEGALRVAHRLVLEKMAAKKRAGS
jgi:hypothetical protein